MIHSGSRNLGKQVAEIYQKSVAQEKKHLAEEEKKKAKLAQKKEREKEVKDAYETFMKKLEAFEKDYSDGGETEGYFLQLSYGKHYKDKGILLRFETKNQRSYANMPDNYPVPNAGEMIIDNINGKKYIKQ